MAMYTKTGPPVHLPYILHSATEQAEQWQKDLDEISSQGSSNPRTPVPSIFSTGNPTSFSDVSTLDKEVQWGQPSTDLPEKRMGKLSRNLRYIIFSAYRRLFTTVFLCNLFAITMLGVSGRLVGTEHIPRTTVAVSANLFVATAIRQEYIINIIFRTCWLIPVSAPLRIRRTLAKCYEYGGVHSGAAISATLWFVLLTGNIIRSFARSEINSILVIVTTSLLMGILTTIVCFAHPRIRTALHDTFERTHRWAGWATIVIFWVEIVVLTWELHGRPHGTAFVKVLVKQPSFWLLFLNTCHAIHPWLRLRKWTFEHEKLSPHAMKLTFSRKIRNFSGIAISKSPLSEWHPFATFPRDDGKQGASLVISNAGDFTNDLIQNPKQQYWVKGLPRHGPMSMAQIFRSVVFVTTGSGIGPCLTFLADQSRRHPVRILWSASRPVETFGENICQKVKSIDAKAVIIDTRVQGRPDLPLMAFQLYKEANAEAVFVLSNGKLTKKVKYAMESRGIPAYGPIFDS